MATPNPDVNRHRTQLWENPRIGNRYYVALIGGPLDGQIQMIPEHYVLQGGFMVPGPDPEPAADPADQKFLDLIARPRPRFYHPHPDFAGVWMVDDLLIKLPHNDDREVTDHG